MAMPQTSLKSPKNDWESIFLYVSTLRFRARRRHSPDSIFALLTPLSFTQTEHIDNPKGYGEGEDARRYHPKLRGPVDPRELEVDPRTGMKNYIANESGTWDTSKALVRRTLERCIHLGRQHAVSGAKQDEYEAYRLLGQALHTLEDFPAHSNFCELSLVSLGHHQVFVHIGDHVKVRAPNGRDVAPLVTGEQELRQRTM